ncbi:MAG: DNA repair protein RadC [Fimbriimonadaceae bacterium]|nr:DNA repair protein RadC [Fimbriimonadaceae bacterium]
METAYSRVQRSGISAGTVVDLLTLAFAQRPEQLPAMEKVALEVLPGIGKAQRLGELSVAELQNYASADPYEATRMAALIEIGRRSAVAGKGDPATVDDAEDVYEQLKYLEREKKEHFVVVMLDSQNIVLRTATVHIGTLTMSVVGPREVFREAIREGASSIIVAHNHPSGDPTPSPEDIAITKELVEIGARLDIPVHDHIIIGYRDHRSLRKVGLMK